MQSVTGRMIQDKEELISKAKKSGWLDPFFVDDKLWGFEQASDVMPKPLPESFQQKQQPSLDPFPRQGFETLAYLFILDNCIEGRFKRTQDLPFFTPAFGETFSNWGDRQSLSFYRVRRKTPSSALARGYKASKFVARCHQETCNLTLSAVA
ncbi:MAG: hypothetical protein ACRC62_23310 [Microcoleus sp.]